VAAEGCCEAGRPPLRTALVDEVAAIRAVAAGDIAALRAALDDPSSFPNVVGLPRSLGESLLVLAVYSGPTALIETLLDQGIDVDPDVNDGFPILIATLSTERHDRYELLERFLRAGADPDRRGINGWTALHWAASHGDARAVDLLLTHNADPNAREDVDDRMTAAEIAAARLEAGLAGGREVLDRLTGSQT